MNSEAALAQLKEGNQRFVEGDNNYPRRDHDRRAASTEGQAPFAIVLSCADSRVMPEAAFDQGIGDLFVVRVAGNVANTSSIASIEYAVAHLGTELIVVLGHESCGAVTAALVGGDNGYNLNHLLSHVEPAKASAGSSDVNTVVKENARQNCKALTDRSSILFEAVRNGKLSIVPAYYHLGSGQIDFIS